MSRTSSSNARAQLRVGAIIDTQTHAKLCALSSLRNVPRGILAGTLIRAALRSVVAREGPDILGNENGPGPQRMVGPQEEIPTGL